VSSVQIANSLYECADTFCEEFTLCLAKHDNVPRSVVYFRLAAKQDKIRLLNLRVWALRYTVDLTFIVGTLLRHFHRIRVMRNAIGRTLGVPIKTSTGENAHRAIIEALNASYPNKENVQAHNDEFKCRLMCIRQPKLSFTGTDPSEFVALYTSEINKVRKRLFASPSKRPWRGNPWLN